MIQAFKRLLGRAREIALSSNKIVINSCGSIVINDLSIPIFKQIVIKPKNVIVYDHRGDKHVFNNVKLVRIVCEE